MDNSLIEGITKIANNEKVIKYLEPNLMCHQDIQEWQTRRVLYALSLFHEEFKKKK